ncbi:hypothetical protein [Halobacillus sp. A5]|uniref:hypothetical protein n=1 Tax=Halobacillus sp. A5 TaxID=2880263 RepID=UPI0020A6AB8B|nr:hypothetical protein [Halobacillus sp. A5]MCP3029092.1 hypothetical protein [Halobacillus sp. A5]
MEKQKGFDSQEIVKMKQRIQAYKLTLETIKKERLLSEDNLSTGNTIFSKMEGALKQMEEEQIDRNSMEFEQFSNRLESLEETIKQLKDDVHSITLELEKLPLADLVESMNHMLILQEKYMEEDRKEKQEVREELKGLKERLGTAQPADQTKRNTQPANFRQLRDMVKSSKQIYDPAMKPYPQKRSNYPQPPVPGSQTINKNSKRNVINSSNKNSPKKKDRQQLIYNKPRSKTIASTKQGEIKDTEQSGAREKALSFFSFFQKRKQYEKK